MKYSKNYLLILLLTTFTCCKSRDYSIIQTQSEEGKSNKSYIEGSIISGSNLKDTLLYYKFDLLTDSVMFKESQNLNIGINYSCMNQDSSYSINLGFCSFTENVKTDTTLVFSSGNKKLFTNINTKNLSKSTETSVGFIKDKYQNPSSSTYLTNKKKMNRFLNLFKDELYDSKGNSDKLLYTSTCYLDGYFQNISMTITYK